MCSIFCSLFIMLYNVAKIGRVRFHLTGKNIGVYYYLLAYRPTKIDTVNKVYYLFCYLFTMKSYNCVAEFIHITCFQKRSDYIVILVKVLQMKTLII